MPGYAHSFVSLMVCTGRSDKFGDISGISMHYALLFYRRFLIDIKEACLGGYFGCVVFWWERRGNIRNLKICQMTEMSDC